MTRRLSLFVSLGSFVHDQKPPPPRTPYALAHDQRSKTSWKKYLHRHVTKRPNWKILSCTWHLWMSTPNFPPLKIYLVPIVYENWSNIKWAPHPPSTNVPTRSAGTPTHERVLRVHHFLRLALYSGWSQWLTSSVSHPKTDPEKKRNAKHDGKNPIVRV